jgi:ATP-dependent protease Clp ATPase subunit
MLEEMLDCSFCGRNQDDTLHMITDRVVQICRECIVQGLDLLTNNKPKCPGGSSVKKTYRATDLGLKCSFCKRKAIDVRAIASINDRKDSICDECIMVFFELILRRAFGEKRTSEASLHFLTRK